MRELKELKNQKKSAIILSFYFAEMYCTEKFNHFYHLNFEKFVLEKNDDLCTLVPLSSVDGYPTWLLITVLIKILSLGKLRALGSIAKHVRGQGKQWG